MIRFSVEALPDGMFVGSCPTYPYLTTIEESFYDALETIQDLVERELEDDHPSDWYM